MLIIKKISLLSILTIFITIELKPFGYLVQKASNFFSNKSEAEKTIENLTSSNIKLENNKKEITEEIKKIEQKKTGSALWGNSEEQKTEKLKSLNSELDEIEKKIKINQAKIAAYNDTKNELNKALEKVEDINLSPEELQKKEKNEKRNATLNLFRQSLFASPFNIQKFEQTKNGSTIALEKVDPFKDEKVTEKLKNNITTISAVSEKIIEDIPKKEIELKLLESTDMTKLDEKEKQEVSEKINNIQNEINNATTAINEIIPEEIKQSIDENISKEIVNITNTVIDNAKTNSETGELEITSEDLIKDISNKDFEENYIKKVLKDPNTENFINSLPEEKRKLFTNALSQKIKTQIKLAKSNYFNNFNNNVKKQISSLGIKITGIEKIFDNNSFSNNVSDKNNSENANTDISNKKVEASNINNTKMLINKKNNSRQLRRNARRRIVRGFTRKRGKNFKSLRDVYKNYNQNNLNSTKNRNLNNKKGK